MTAGRIRATRTPVGQPAQPVRLCQRCGIPRTPGGRTGPLCKDCRDVDPRWGRHAPDLRAGR
jgi:hypothetical protein